MGRPRKKTKIDHNSSLDTNQKNTDLISTDVVNEILQRLPAKSVAKFVGVSKSWATIIRSNYFIKSFSLQQSMEFQIQQEPYRLLFAFNEISHNSKNHWAFFSSTIATTNEKPPLKLISSMNSQFNSRFAPPIYVKGLLSFTCGKTQVIHNPSIGKSIILPIVKSRRKVLKRYFGFDPINFEYKVLCIIDPMYVRGNRIPPSQNQILTVGPKSSWREIDLWIPHRPVSTGICIDGVIYYLAYQGLDLLDPILVRFDVRSEKFMKQLPCSFLGTLGISLTKLMNYKSKLAIGYKTNYELLDLWVLEDGEKVEWLKINHDVSSYNCLISGYEIRILGTTPRGEIVYTFYGIYVTFYVVYHDLEKNQHRKFVDITPYQGFFMSRVGFLDYVESVMLL